MAWAIKESLKQEEKKAGKKEESKKGKEESEESGEEFDEGDSKGEEEEEEEEEDRKEEEEVEAEIASKISSLFFCQDIIFFLNSFFYFCFSQKNSRGKEFPSFGDEGNSKVAKRDSKQHLPSFATLPIQSKTVAPSSPF